MAGKFIPKLKADPKGQYVGSYFQTEQNVYESRISDTSKAGREKYIGDQVQNANTFQFAPVIYLRNKNVVLVYMLRLCGTECGVEELSFYKQINGTYERWIVINGKAF